MCSRVLYNKYDYDLGRKLYNVILTKSILKLSTINCRSPAVPIQDRLVSLSQFELEFTTSYSTQIIKGV